jgi:hypothetical protein
VQAGKTLFGEMRPQTLVAGSVSASSNPKPRIEPGIIGIVIL